MFKNIPLFAIIIVLLYALYHANVHKKNSDILMNKNYKRHIAAHPALYYKEELEKLYTVSYIRQYIMDVINHGSDTLHFNAKEVMEGGFAQKEDAGKIACYVLAFSGKRCKEAYGNDAAMFYSSICAGCHGENGKGLHGTYPDLTKEKLLGIQKREDFLKKMIKSSHFDIK